MWPVPTFPKAEVIPDDYEAAQNRRLGNSILYFNFESDGEFINFGRRALTLNDPIPDDPDDEPPYIEEPPC